MLFTCPNPLLPPLAPSHPLPPCHIRPVKRKRLDFLLDNGIAHDCARNYSRTDSLDNDCDSEKTDIVRYRRDVWIDGRTLDLLQLYFLFFPVKPEVTEKEKKKKRTF